jgi:hypothetical protein
MIVLTYLLPLLGKIVIYITSGADIVIIIASITSFILLLSTSYFTWKGNIISKYITSAFFFGGGLLMLPWYISPRIDSQLLSICLGSLGVFWILSSVWIFRKYP